MRDTEHEGTRVMVTALHKEVGPCRGMRVCVTTQVHMHYPIGRV